ncbi:MAG: tetratricopeptide repeat protein, partial [Candidatus Promineifilaceae bacterium]
VGMTAGLLGLAAFGFFLLRTGRLLWKKLNSPLDRPRRLLLMAIIAAIAGHLIELQFSFETIGTAVVFWLLLAVGVSGADTTSSQTELKVDGSQKLPMKSVPLIVVFLILLGSLTIRPLLADHAYWLGLQSPPSSTKTLGHFIDATQYWPIEPQYHLGLGEAYWDQGQPYAAASEMVMAAQLQAGKAQLWAAVGDIYARWAASEPDRFSQALAAFRRSVTLSPNTAAYHTALGLVLAESGHLAEGISEIEKAVDLDATDIVAYTHLSRLYAANAQKNKAAWAEDQARHWANTIAMDGG